jgi:hypothetical protein
MIGRDIVGPVQRHGMEEPMDDLTFDRLVRLVSTTASRRKVVKSASASALGALGLAALLGAEEVRAKKGGKKRKRRRCKPKPAGTSCQTDKDCCTKKTKRVCKEPFNQPGEDPVCCGEEGTPCKFPSDCCNGFDCPTPGECVPI